MPESLAIPSVSAPPPPPQPVAPVAPPPQPVAPPPQPVTPQPRPVNKTGPGNLGTPATNIRTQPSPKGTNAAAPKITPQGQPQPQAPTASVATNAPKKSPSPAPSSSGAPSRGKALLDNAAETARSVAAGKGNARTLGILGAAALLGVGVASSRSKRSIPQDQGTYMDDSRRRLEY